MELVHYGDVKSVVYDSIAHAYKRDMYTYISLVPRPSHPSVCCSTNMGEGLVKLITCNDVPGRWANVWRSGTFP